MYGELDNSSMRKHRNLIDDSNFPGSIYGKNFMVSRVPNALKQRNEDPFLNPADSPKGLTPFLSPSSYSQLDRELHATSQQEWLAQSSLINDVSNPHARSIREKLKSPSTYSENYNSDYDPLSVSEFWTSNLQSKNPDLNDIFDNLSSIQKDHNTYSKINSLPATETEFHESMLNSISEYNFGTIIQNKLLNNEKSTMTKRFETQPSSDSPSLFENKVHNFVSAKESMNENHIINCSNNLFVTPNKPIANRQTSLANNIANEFEPKNRPTATNIDDYSSQSLLSASKIQREKKSEINKNFHSNLAGGSFQKDTKLAPKKSIIRKPAKRGKEKFKEEYNQFYSTPVGGLIDYKLNLYHIHLLSDFKTSEIGFSIKDFKNILMKPSFSYILISKNFKSDEKYDFQKLDLDFFAAKLSSQPIDKVRFKHFEYPKFKIHSQTELNEFLNFFNNDPRLAEIRKNPVTIDYYINSIFNKMDLESSINKLTFDILNTHQNIIPKTEKEEVFRNFSFLSKLIVSPYITESLRPIVPLKSNDNKAKKFLNEISTQFGIKRINCLGLGEEIILKNLEYLKEKFDGRLKKYKTKQLEWCEIAVRVILSAANKIILFYRIFTPFDENCIENLKENLKKFSKYSKYFFLQLFEYFDGRQNNSVGKDLHSDSEIKKKYYGFYTNYKKVRFEYECSKYLLSNWLNYNPNLDDSIEEINLTNSRRINSFLNNCLIVDFFESHKYPLEHYYWS
ncbi:hypothetical protein BY996DRAFT_7576132 [Phakopsora pachyrhizi]|nr:hypothetical protein BY996DRAFT_7576132 [Phakopsora pachyrhizi]